MINSYYRKKNQLAIDNYKTMIEQEDAKSYSNNKSIKKMNDEMKSLEKKIEKKQKKLKNVLEEINHYAV